MLKVTLEWDAVKDRWFWKVVGPTEMEMVSSHPYHWKKMRDAFENVEAYLNQPAKLISHTTEREAR